MVQKEGEKQTNEIASARVGVELGASGTLVTHGIISGEDYNSELTGLTGISAYERMRNDATVNASLDILKLPILAANWYIEPGKEDDEMYKEHADFIQQELFHNEEQTFTEFLREALLYLDYGRYVFEIVYKLRTDGRIGWKKFAPRMPKTIYYWETDDGKPGIQQLLPDGKNASIPNEKLIRLTNRQEGDNYEGRSVLRTSYRNWYTKDALYKIQAIALERQGVGIPYVKTPSAASKKDRLRAEEFLRNLRANEESYLEWKEGWEFGFMDMGANNMDPAGAIAHHNREIMKNILAQFMELGAATGSSGSSSSGSHALSKDQSRLLILSLQYIANYVRGIMMKDAIRRLIIINFGEQEFYPKLCVAKIGDADFSALATALKSLVDSGLITPTPGTEDHLRDLMTLPEMPEELRAEMEFDAILSKLEEDEMALQQQEDSMAAEDQMMEDNAMEESEDETDENIEASEYMMDDAITMSEVMNIIFTGAAGIPLSQEHRSKISESLKRYWSSRKKAKVKKTKKSNKGKSRLSESEKAARKEKSTKVKNIRLERRTNVRNLRSNFRKKKMEAKQKLMERKLRGDKPSKEDYMRMQIDLLKAQSEMLDKIDKIYADSDKKISVLTGSEELHMPSVIKLKEEVDNVIAKIQKEIA